MPDQTGHTSFINGYRAAFHFELKGQETAPAAAERHVRDWLILRGGESDRFAVHGWDGRSSAVLPSGTKVGVATYSHDMSGNEIVRYRLTESREDGPIQMTVAAFNYHLGSTRNAAFVHAQRRLCN